MNAIVVFVLSVLMVDIGHGEDPASPTCDQLPKIDAPTSQLLSGSSPYEYDYTVSTVFDCYTKVFTNPARGSPLSGSALSVMRSEVVIFDYTVGSDNKTFYVTTCNTGAKSVWYASAAQFDANGSFVCLYYCNGTALGEYKCFSNNNGASAAELQAIEVARKMPNGNLIHNAKEKCIANRQCNAF